MENATIPFRKRFSRIWPFAWSVKGTIVELVSFTYAVLFLYTGINKIIDYSVFKEQISDIQILNPIAPFIALGLPLFEFLLSIQLLLIPRWRLKGLYASITLMVLFTWYIIYLLVFSPNMPCSCGGLIELLSWKEHLWLNGCLIILGLLAITFEKKSKLKLDRNVDKVQ